MKRIQASLLLLSLAAAAVIVSACTANGETPPSSAPTAQASTHSAHSSSGSRVLVAYFSRYGNTNYEGRMDTSTSASIVANGNNLQGTTERLAQEIQSRTGGDLFLIHAASPYPTQFDDVVEQNHEELSSHIFPALSTMPDMNQYDTIFIGYPVWSNTIPRPVATFIRDSALAGKTVIPFCTHDGYSSGRSYDEIRSLAGGTTVLSGLAVEASNVSRSEDAVSHRLSQLPLPKETHIPSLSVNEETVAVTWDDTPFAREILGHAPFSLSMINYGGREYYGSIDFRPEHRGDGKRNFEDGAITYCPQNNTLAIFYAQTDNPNLTMDVIRIGRVRGDLSRFHKLGQHITFAIQ